MNAMDQVCFLVAKFFDNDYCIDKQWEGTNIESSCCKIVDIHSAAIPEMHLARHSRLCFSPSKGVVNFHNIRQILHQRHSAIVTVTASIFST